MRQYLLLEICIFLASIILFIWGLYPQEITSFDSRFYLFAKEMLQNGIGWFPTTYGQPYPDYPVISTLLIYLSATLFGGLNKLTAVLPSALAAAWTVVLTYRIGSLRDRNWGLIATAMVLMTLMFLKSARSISLDMYPAMFTAWSFYLLVRAEQEKIAVSSWIYIFLILSFAFRGPIGLVMPAGVVCSYYFLNFEWKKLIFFGAKAVAILLACIAILLGIAYTAGGEAFLQDVIRMQFAGRIDNNYQPLYFYFTNSIGNYALSYPLALISILVISISGQQRKKLIDNKNLSFILKLIGWMLVILVGMTVPGDKKARYILPMVPAIALIAAYPFMFKMKTMRSKIMLFATAFLLNIIYIEAVESRLIHNEGARQLVTMVENERSKANAQLVFYREAPDGTPIKYQIYNERGDHPIFITTEQQLLAVKSRAFFITSEEYFKQLPVKVLAKFKILTRGRLGHVDVVVFTQLS